MNGECGMVNVETRIPHSPVACYLGIDYGTKRIGLAIGDRNTAIASPLKTLASTGRLADDAAAILDCVKEYHVDAFVVGLPFNMDDTEGEQAKMVRRFGHELARLSGLEVHYWDERLSSFTAQELLQPAGLTRKKRKARLDRIAAQVILQDFLDAWAEERKERE